MTEEQWSEMYQNAIRQNDAQAAYLAREKMRETEAHFTSSELALLGQQIGACAFFETQPQRTVDIGTWWSPREDVRASFSMRVVSRDNGKVQLEAPLWDGHCLSWETTEADLLGRWVEVE